MGAADKVTLQFDVLVKDYGSEVIDKFGRNVGIAGDKLKAAGADAKLADGGFDKATAGAGKLGTSLDKLAGEADRSGRQVKGAGNDAEKAGNDATGSVSKWDRLKAAVGGAGREADESQPKIGRLRGAWRGLSGEVDEHGRKLKGAGSAWTGMIGAMAAGAATTAAVGFFKDSVAGARESIAVSKQTANAVKVTGAEAWTSASKIGALATAISNKTGVDDEAIQSGSNLLLTFKGVRNEVGKGNDIFDRATKSAVDLSAAGFGSVTSASKMLGKALNDPTKGISALSRAGVTFSDDQKAMVDALQHGGFGKAFAAMGGSVSAYNATLKRNGGDINNTIAEVTDGMTAGQKKQFAYLAEGGHAMDAQKMILKEVEGQVKGSAAAQATSADKLKVSWGNFQESVGSQLIPVMDKMLGIGAKVTAWASENPGTVKLLAIGVGVLAGAFGLASVAVWAMNSAMLASPITWAIVGIAALVAGVVWAYNKFDWFKGSIDAVWGVLKAVGGWIGDNWKTILIGLGGPVVWAGALIAKHFGDIKDAAYAVGKKFGDLKDGIGGAMKGAKEAVGDRIDDIVTKFSAGKERIGGIVHDIKDKLGEIPDKFTAIKNEIGRVWGGVTELIRNPLGAGLDVFNKFGDLINKILPGDPIKHIDKPKGWFTGGRTLDIDPSQVAGVVHGREMVINARSTDRLDRDFGPGFLDSLNGYKGGGRVWPTVTKALSNNYAGHSGVDIAAPMHSPMYAAEDGRVLYTGWGKGYGDAIFLALASGIDAVYGHGDTHYVKAGDTVTAGQTIGLTASTGNSSGPHLHFEIDVPGPFDNVANRPNTLAYLNGASFSGGKPGGGFLGGILGKLGSMWSGLWDDLTLPAGSLLGVSDLKNLMKPVLGAVKDKVSIFDEGGLWPSGTLAANTSGLTERVLTSSTDAQLQRTLADMSRLTEDGLARAIARELVAAGVGAVQLDSRDLATSQRRNDRIRGTR